MSRDEVTNEKFMCAFGVDHITGSYVQVWLQPVNEQDGALVVIDNLGVRTNGSTRILPTSAVHFLSRIEASYDFAAGARKPAPHLDSETIAALLSRLGFPNMGQRVYKALG